jgi:hypothetical protein
VDVVVDERLAKKADGSGLLGCQPTVDGELWVCYLEKALAIHCGGWDRIDGGTCTHGWMLLTGCREVYTIIKDDETGKFGCYGELLYLVTPVAHPHDHTILSYPTHSYGRRVTR